MRHVLEVLESYGDVIFPKRSSLAKRCGMTLRTLDRMLDRLKHDGLITVERRGPTSALYVLSLKPESGNSCGNSFGNSFGNSSAPHLFTELKLEVLELLTESQRKRAIKAKNPAAYAQAIISSEARLRDVRASAQAAHTSTEPPREAETTTAPKETPQEAAERVREMAEIQRNIDSIAARGSLRMPIRGAITAPEWLQRIG